MLWKQEIALISTGEPVTSDRFGERAARLSFLAAEGATVAPSVGLSCKGVAQLTGDAQAREAAEAILTRLGDGLVVLRSSPPDIAWGGPPSTLHIGLNEAMLPDLGDMLGVAEAEAIYLETIVTHAVTVCGIDAGQFKHLDASAGRTAIRQAIAEARLVIKSETGEPFPEDRVSQLSAALKAASAGWNQITAKILRQASGAPADAGLALLVQSMKLGEVKGRVQEVDPASGKGRFEAMLTARDGRDLTVADLPEGVAERLHDLIRSGSRVLRDAARVRIVLADGEPWVIDLETAARKSRAEVRIVTDLVEQGILTREEALLRIEPTNLLVHLHPQIDVDAVRDVFATGIGASPGAAQGKLVFTAEAAQVAASQGEDAILVRSETSPEDIRGMNSAVGVLTLTGGTTSHAAVIAQGLGLPCVVGARARIDAVAETLESPDGRVLRAGELVTLDGKDGNVLAGAVPLTPAEPSVAYRTLMEWTDAVRDLGVRANADTPADAQMARRFRADGIGLCRSEHMFYAADRIDVMREMILEDDPVARQSVLDKLLPMQREDYTALFEIMAGMPVTIRLLDPPLHEFLPKGEAEIAAMAASMGREKAEVANRIADLEEYNPMLGKRGVRLGVTMPEIYAMQARAIFEAAIEASKRTETPVTPEIMIPLISARREVEMVSDHIQKVALDVEAECGTRPEYRLGVMVETPRAVLRAGDLAKSAAFFSFGTNDLTQMVFGMSRDDSGRFMREYVNNQVFEEDPFLSLDIEAVGEMLSIATQRGREANPDLSVSLCGEHGGDPASIRFCKIAGFDYVSCSPFRVPIARLAAAQSTLLARQLTGGDSDFDRFVAMVGRFAKQ